MSHRFLRVIASLAGIGVLAACQTAPTLRPAILTPADADAVRVIKVTLSEALGRAQVDIIPADLSGTTDLSVPPPPLSPQETRSPVLPTQFGIATDGTACFLVNADTGEQYLLRRLRCRAAAE